MLNSCWQPILSGSVGREPLTAIHGFDAVLMLPSRAATNFQSALCPLPRTSPQGESCDAASMSFRIVSIALTSATPSSAQPAFVNGILIRETSSTRLASPAPTADGSASFRISITTRRLTSGGRCRTAVRAGTISYGTRVQRFSIDINPITGAISHFRVLETVKFTDPKGLLTGTGKALNGLNPSRPERLRGHAGPQLRSRGTGDRSTHG